MAQEAALTEVHELVTHAVANMATKEDLANGLAGVREEMTEGFVAIEQHFCLRAR